MALDPIDTMQPGPVPALLPALGPCLFPARHAPVGVAVFWDNDDSKGGMGEDRSTLVEQQIYCKLDSITNDPTKGSEMVIGDVVEKKWVVRSKLGVRNWREV
jgi:hypothetical protein